MSNGRFGPQPHPSDSRATFHRYHPHQIHIPGEPRLIYNGPESSYSRNFFHGVGGPGAGSNGGPNNGYTTYNPSNGGNSFGSTYGSGSSNSRSGPVNPGFTGAPTIRNARGSRYSVPFSGPAAYSNRGSNAQHSYPAILPQQPNLSHRHIGDSTQSGGVRHEDSNVPRNRSDDVTDGARSRPIHGQGLPVSNATKEGSSSPRNLDAPVFPNISRPFDGEASLNAGDPNSESAINLMLQKKPVAGSKLEQLVDYLVSLHPDFTKFAASFSESADKTALDKSHESLQTLRDSIQKKGLLKASQAQATIIGKRNLVNGIVQNLADIQTKIYALSSEAEDLREALFSVKLDELEKAIVSKRQIEELTVCAKECLSRRSFESFEQDAAVEAAKTQQVQESLTAEIASSQLAARQLESALTMLEQLAASNEKVISAGDSPRDKTPREKNSREKNSREKNSREKILREKRETTPRERTSREKTPMNVAV